MVTEKEWSMEDCASIINKTVHLDKDFVMVVSGETGSGKSTLAIKLAKKLNPDFSIEKDIVYSREELIEKINNYPKFSVIVADEAITSLFKRDFMKKEQKSILRLFDMCRYKNLIIILCVPIFWALDKHILESKVRLRLHIERTGLTFLFRPTNHPHSPDVWARKYNLTVCPRWDYYPDATKMIGFLGIMHFGDLCANDKRIYVQIREEKKEAVRLKEIQEEEAKKEERMNLIETGKILMLENLKSIDGLKPGVLTHLAKLEGVTPTGITHRLEKARKIKTENSKLLAGVNPPLPTEVTPLLNNTTIKTTPFLENPSPPPKDLTIVK